MSPADLRPRVPIRDSARRCGRARHWFAALQRSAPIGHEHLVTILVVLPRIDRSTSVELEDLHRTLKDEFVAEGLMIGQFHPHCEARGLWSPEFRPLQSPVPLLAIREMVPSDLPFLVSSTGHADVYFERYARSIPAHRGTTWSIAWSARTEPNRDRHATEVNT